MIWEIIVAIYVLGVIWLIWEAMNAPVMPDDYDLSIEEEDILNALPQGLYFGSLNSDVMLGQHRSETRQKPGPISGHNFQSGETTCLIL